MERQNAAGSGFSARDEAWVLILLTFAAGCLDAIVFLGLGSVFCGNMTGNSVLLSLSLAQGHLGRSLLSACALCGFLVGVAIGSALVARDRRRNGWTKAVVHGVLAEAALLGIFALCWHAAANSAAIDEGLVALSALTMGLQSAIARQLSPMPVVTTYITGTVASAITGLVQGPEAGDPARTAEWRRRTAMQGGVFLVYGLAAAASGLVVAHWRSWATLLPLSALFGVLAFAALHEKH